MEARCQQAQEQAGDDSALAHHIRDDKKFQIDKGCHDQDGENYAD